MSEETAFQIGRFCTFQTSVTLTLHQVKLYLHTKGQTDTETGFVRLTQFEDDLCSKTPSLLR